LKIFVQSLYILILTFKLFFKVSHFH
jgi:hypothetical protein